MILLNYIYGFICLAVMLLVYTHTVGTEIGWHWRGFCNCQVELFGNHGVSQTPPDHLTLRMWISLMKTPLRKIRLTP